MVLGWRASQSIDPSHTNRQSTLGCFFFVYRLDRLSEWLKKTLFNLAFTFLFAMLNIYNKEYTCTQKTKQPNQ